MFTFGADIFRTFGLTSLSQPQEIKADNKEKKVAIKVNQEKYQDTLKHCLKQTWVSNCYAEFSFMFSDLCCKLVEMRLENQNSFTF